MPLEVDELKRLLTRVRDATHTNFPHACTDVFEFVDANVGTNNPAYSELQADRSGKWGQWAPAGMCRWKMPSTKAERLSLAWHLNRSVAERKDVGSGGLLHGMYAQDFPSNVDRFRADFLQYLVDALNAIGAADPESIPAAGRVPTRPTSGPSFVAESRIEELRSTTGSPFDFSRLIRLCEELNLCMENECFLSVAALTRGLLDHIPPVFGLQRTFNGLLWQAPEEWAFVKHSPDGLADEPSFFLFEDLTELADQFKNGSK